MCNEILRAVLINMIPYVVALLLPLIPAIFIFKIFPDTKVSIKGPLSQFALNSTGAFAAYIITFFLGWPVIKEYREIVVLAGRPTWTIHGRFELKDKDKNSKRSQGVKFISR